MDSDHTLRSSSLWSFSKSKQSNTKILMNVKFYREEKDRWKKKASRSILNLSGVEMNHRCLADRRDRNLYYHQQFQGTWWRRGNIHRTEEEIQIYSHNTKWTWIWNALHFRRRQDEHDSRKTMSDNTYASRTWCYKLLQKKYRDLTPRKWHANIIVVENGTWSWSARHDYIGHDRGRSLNYTPRELQQEDAGQDVPNTTRVHVSQNQQGRTISKFGTDAMWVEVEQDDDGTWRRREDTRSVRNVDVGREMSQGNDGAHIDEVK